MGVNGGMADYVTRDELIKELDKLRVEFDQRVDGHREEIMKAITWWSQQQEKHKAERREMMASAEELRRDQERTAEVVDAINRLGAARQAEWEAFKQHFRGRVAAQARLRESLERLLEDSKERHLYSLARDDFHAMRLNRVEERTDRLEDRLFHGDPSTPRVDPPGA
jgi:hypothetical protein